MDVRVLYSDDHIVAAIKPCGVLSEDGAGEQGMPTLLRDRLGGEIYPVHRLDRTTAGVMVYARTKFAAARLSEAIANGSLHKAYLAAVEGDPGDGGELCDLLYYDRARNKSYVVTRERRGVKQALLRYERLALGDCECSTVALVKVALLTGRTHQIRVQFASRRHPLVGDRRYGSAIPAQSIALCAAEISFPHPATGEPMRFACEPEDAIFRRLMRG